MYQSLIAASVFILTLTLGLLSSGIRTSQDWGSLLWLSIGAVTCGVINFCVRNSRSKPLRFGFRVLNLMSAGFVLGVSLTGSGSFCGNSTAEEIYWNRIWGITFLTVVGALIGIGGAVGGIADDRRAESGLFQLSSES